MPGPLLLQRVLQTADGVLNLSLGLVTLTLGSQLRVTDDLTGRLFDRALGLLSCASDPILIHVIVAPLVEDRPALLPVRRTQAS